MTGHDAYPIEVVDYDPEWPDRFEAERERLATALADHDPAIEHIGSTAVPGLAAKSCIDLLVGVEDVERAAAAVAALIELGYQYVPEYEVQFPERRYFRRGAPADFHVHMVDKGGDFWRRHLGFRDRLRADPGAAHDYAELKRSLAARHPYDRAAYSKGKEPFVDALLRGSRPAG